MEVGPTGTGLLLAHRAALAHTQGYVSGVPAGAWSSPTPCEGWDARGLLTHIVSGNLWVGELTAGRTIDEVGDALDGDVLGGDPVGAYARSAEIADAGFSRPGALNDPVAVSYGPVPGEVYAGHRFLDVLVHGWDLAVATGQDRTLPPELVDAVFLVLEPQMDMLRASGMFGDDHTAEVGDDPQSRLLGLLGRDPQQPSPA